MKRECCVSADPIAAEDDLKPAHSTSVSVVCTLTDFNTLEEFCSFIHILYTKWISETSGALLYIGPDSLHALLLIQDLHFLSHGTCNFLFFFWFFFGCDFTVQMSLHQILKPGAVAAPVTAKEFILLYLILFFWLFWFRYFKKKLSDCGS